MIGVTVDRPMGEDDVGFLRLHDLADSGVTSRIDLGGPIDLSGEDRPGLQNGASLFCFGGTDSSSFVRRLAFDAGLATRQIQNGHFMAAVYIAGNRAAATGFRIIRMSTGDEHFEPSVLRRFFRSHGDCQSRGSQGTRTTQQLTACPEFHGVVSWEWVTCNRSISCPMAQGNNPP